MADFEDDWGEDSGETTPLPVPSTAKIWLSVLVGAAVVVCLPDDAACKSEMLWLWRARLRRQLLGFLEAVVKSPLVQLVAYLLRSISFGIFSARCRAPHSLSAKVVGSGHLLLRWRTRTPELNPLHQEHYVVACRTVEGHTTSSACAAGRQHSTEPSASGQDSDVWKEWRISDNLLVNEENSWAAVLDCLPRNSCLRLRVWLRSRGLSLDDTVEPQDPASKKPKPWSVIWYARLRLAFSSGPLASTGRDVTSCSRCVGQSSEHTPCGCEAMLAVPRTF
eukprot:TRINITY_DN25953_c1_g1_i1.p1 TRINITY_DN25953_c1_g1~~TRINITY_DN25953_c1_g1_i1.p1  ORF type:complete len:278 (-),score=27.94 TRINITY_DN25953_c1_g1_i1:390-1223(-)